MLPLRDDIASKRTPYFTWLLIAINMLVFFFQLSLGPGNRTLLFHLGMIPERVIFFLHGGEIGLPAVILPFFTSMFLHGGWLHVLGNMWFLFVFGDNVEDRLGHGPFILFYLSGGLAAGLIHLLFNPGSPVPAVGASGAIAAVLAAYLLFYPHARILTLIPFFIPVVEIPSLLVIGYWFAVQLFNGLLSMGDPGAAGGVGWWAHIGGFVFGLAAAWERSRPANLRGEGHF